MVYTALQLISRGREGGLSVIDLGKKTGYDQKTCYYLIEQLKGLDLVCVPSEPSQPCPEIRQVNCRANHSIKLSQGGPGGGNFCIHKYFYARSPFWEGVRREEAAGGDEDDENPLEPIGSQVDSPSKLHFDPIDSRHLTSTQLIKSRLVRLLKNSENGLHSYQNLLVTIVSSVCPELLKRMRLTDHAGFRKTHQKGQTIFHWPNPRTDQGTSH